MTHPRSEMAPGVVAFPRRADPVEIEQVFIENISLTLRKRPKEVQIDLQGVKFFEPYGITFLALTCRYLSSQGFKLTVRLPRTDTQQAFYLKRMSVPQLLRKWAHLENILWSKGRGWEARSPVLMELTPFRRAIEAERIVVRRVYQILKTQLHYKPADLSAFSNIVAELCENVQDHSHERESGFVAAQAYKSRYGSTKGKRCVLIAVADLGIGIRASLGERYDVSSWSCATALDNAILRNYSRSADRGLGFATVRHICGEHHGQLHVRSGDAALTIRQSRGVRFAGTFFPGTQVGIKLWE